MGEDLSNFDEGLLQSYNEEIDKGYFLEVGVKHPENLQSLHNDDFFTWKNENWNWKNRKSVHNVHNEIEFVVHIRNLKLALNHGLVLKKVLKVINFNQKAWLRPCIDMNTDLRKKTKKRFRSRLYQIDQ